MTRHFAFIAHHLIAAWQAKGWRVINDMSECHHGDHAVLMELDG